MPPSSLFFTNFCWNLPDIVELNFVRSIERFDQIPDNLLVCLVFSFVLLYITLVMLLFAMLIIFYYMLLYYILLYYVILFCVFYYVIHYFAILCCFVKS